MFTKLGAKNIQLVACASQAQRVVRFPGSVLPLVGGVALKAVLKSVGVLLSPIATKLQPGASALVAPVWKLLEFTGARVAVRLDCRFTLVGCAAFTQNPSPAFTVLSTS